MLPSAFIFIILFLGSALLHGMVGLGFPIVSTAVLAFFLPIPEAVTLTLVPTLCINFINFISGHSIKVILKEYWILALTGVLGSLLGAQLLFILPSRYLEILLALFILFYVARNIKRQIFHIPGTAKVAALFGFLGGIIGGATNAMSPIIMMYLFGRTDDKNKISQAANLCFGLGKLGQIIIVWSAFAGTPYLSFVPTLWHSAMGIIGVLLGIRLRRYISPLLFKRICLVILALLALTMLVRTLTNF